MLRALLSIFLLSFTVLGYGQSDWDVPWTVIGDSSKINQRVSVTGTVTIKGTGEPLTGASISAETFKHFDYSDENGRYILILPPGSYRILVRHIGYKGKYIRLKVISSGVYDVEMEEGVTSLDEIVVTSRPLDSNVKQSLPGITSLNIQEIRTLPTLMGEVDIVKSLQLMPGVSSVGEGSSGFNVRGGRMDQNLILLNDVPLFSSAHALGFVSAFNQDVLKDFTLYKGNVPANYGGRASSVLQINTRRGDYDKWIFQGGVGPVSSRFTAEGPVSKGNTSLLVAGRLSHANWILKKVDDPDVKHSRLSFYDGFVGLSHRFSPNSVADVTFYSSQDEFKFSNQFGYSWSNYLLSAKWQALANRKASPVFSASYGHFKSSLIDPEGIDASRLTNTLNYFQLSETVNYEPNDKHAIVAGISGVGYLPKPEYIEGYAGNTNITRRSVDKNHGVELALYVNDDFKVNNSFSVSAGLRYSFYSHLGSDTVFQYPNGLSRTEDSITDTLYYSSGKKIKSFGGLEPRISARISVAPNQSIKISYNRMRQYIHLISNTTAPTPIDLWQVSNQYLPPQIADNYSIGYFLNMRDNIWETSAEIFYKQMQNLVEYKDFPILYLNNHLETELLSGKGRAYGGEIYIRRLKGRWTGWISYTYSQTHVKVASKNGSESINEGEWFPSNYNKPHTFNIVVDRKLQNHSAFSIIATYSSGRPLTAIESSYIVDGSVIPVYSKRNKYQIPAYFRVDISFTVGNVLKKIDDSLVFSLYNLFGKDNTYSVFYQRPANNFFIPKAYQLSILGSALPSLTYNFKF